MSTKQFTFYKSCEQLRKDELDLHEKMQEVERPIEYVAFRRAVGGEELDRWAAARGYETGRSREGGLRLSKDWHVSYHRSMWGDRPCYYLVWSAFEMIWL